MKIRWKIKLNGFSTFGFDMIVNHEFNTMKNTDQHHYNEPNLQYANTKRFNNQIHPLGDKDTVTFYHLKYLNLLL